MAQAQSYPTKPVRFVISFPPGGPNDILGRIVAGWLSQKLGQPFNVENKGGRSGNIAHRGGRARARADGYTVLLCGPANAISGSLYPNLQFNFLRDIVPVAGITREALVMVVHPSVPAKTVPEFLAYAKANPGKIKMASTGNGSSPHVTGELFKQMTGLTLEVVHYGGGGPALQGDDRGRSADDVRADVGVDRAGAQRQAPRARGDHDDAFDGAAGGRRRWREFVPGYEASAVTGIGVPKGTPAEVVETLNKAVQAAFADAAMKAKLADTGGEPLPGTAAEFAAADGGRDREVGQGGEGGGDQGGVRLRCAATVHVMPA